LVNGSFAAFRLATVIYVACVGFSLPARIAQPRLGGLFGFHDRRSATNASASVRSPRRIAAHHRNSAGPRCGSFLGFDLPRLRMTVAGADERHHRVHVVEGVVGVVDPRLPLFGQVVLPVPDVVPEQ